MRTGARAAKVLTLCPRAEHGPEAWAFPLWANTREQGRGGLQEQVSNMARHLDWLTYHTWTSMHSQSGYPDLHCLRGERSVFIELKRVAEPLTAAQERYREALLAAGHEHYVFRPCDMDEIEEVLR